MRLQDIPAFGVLAGVRVMTVGQAVAGPFAGSLMSDHGASVIHVENTLAKDVSHFPGVINEQDHRNQLNMSFNMRTDEGREILFKLLKDTDILIENSKGGQWDRWGLSDDVLWEVNPALIITHVSGYGQTGDPKYVKRGAWDTIGQAFGTLAFYNGTPDTPMTCNVIIGDQLAALYACVASLAAYIRRLKTGKGESIDVAQYEACLRGLAGFPLHYLTEKYPPEHNLYQRQGGKTTGAGIGLYKCSDGYVYLSMVGLSAMKKGLPFFGLEFESDLFPADCTMIEKSLNPEGYQVLNNAVIEYCAVHSMQEVDDAFDELSIPCSPIHSPATTEHHPHYVARETYTEWKGVEGDRIKGVNIIPKLKNSPGKIWRGAPNYGQDNDDVLAELGYTTDQIASFYEKGVLNKD